MGPLDNITGFTQSQKDMYNSLRHIKHKIAHIHGPFGTGKTRAIIKVIVKYLSNPQKKQQVLYVTRSNIGVEMQCQDARKNVKSMVLTKSLFVPIASRASVRNWSK